jgi:hypothetical protein
MPIPVNVCGFGIYERGLRFVIDEFINNLQ